jgi:predicted TIM-barrel fold metal-dependent hydrolase
VRRCAKDWVLRAVFLRSNPLVDHKWHDPYYEPLWNAIEENNLSLGFSRIHRHREKSHGDAWSRILCCAASSASRFEQMLALGSFCGGGVFGAPPEAPRRVSRSNCSWLPWLLWRLDEGWEREGDVWAKDLTMKPSDYFKRQCVVSVEPDEATIKQVIEYMGGNHVVFSTDYPHGDSKYPTRSTVFSTADHGREQTQNSLG